ncbi:MAG: PD-(D/E)XK nuclease family protein, partial [Anaerolineae bacterium]|nr:PD-(D/E)XK nuclease family protein [Anaerolineae bacterium]
RWLKQRLVVDGMRPGEVALLARNIEPYRAFVVQTAEEFGLPVHVLNGQPLSSNPAVAAVMDLLTLVVPGEAHLTWRETVAAWRSPYFDWVPVDSEVAVAGSEAAVVDSEVAVASAIGIAAEDAETLELIARWASVIGGYEQWEAAFAWLREAGSPKGSRDEEGPALPEALPTGEAATALWQTFERFVTRITLPEGCRSSAEHVAWLEALIGDVEAPEDGPPFPDLGVARRALTGPAGAELASAELASAELGARDEAALNALKDVLRGLVRAEAAVEGAPVGFPDFLADLIAAVDAATYHLPLPVGEEAVAAADVHQARGVAFRAVAVLGMAEGEFPAASAEDPLLRDADREVLRDTFGMAVDLSTESIETQAFYEAITRPREALLLTRPRIADNGAPWQPSPYWEEVRRRVAVTPRDLTSADRPAPAQAASWPELLQVLAAAPACAEQVGVGWEWARKRRPADTGRIARAQTILAHRSGAVSVAPAAADPGSVDPGSVDPAAHDGDLMRWHAIFAEAYAPDRTWSASRLESYRTCPFFFFAANVLRLEPRPLPEEGLDARQLGNIYHHIFEALTRRAGRDADLVALLDALPAVAGEILDAAPRVEQFRETAWWQQTRAEIQENVARSLRALDALDGDFVFYAAEQTFGMPDLPGKALVVRDGTGDSFRLRGFIDRVDRAPDGGLRIIDYKTGGKSPYTSAAVREGKKLQLPLYALAAQEALHLGDVVEGFYWHVRQAEPSSFTMARFRSDEGTGPAAAIDCAVTMAWQAVRGARAGHFVPKAPDGGCPDYCPAAAFCRHYTAGRWG